MTDWTPTLGQGRLLAACSSYLTPLLNQRETQRASCFPFDRPQLFTGQSGKRGVKARQSQLRRAIFRTDRCHDRHLHLWYVVAIYGRAKAMTKLISPIENTPNGTDALKRRIKGTNRGCHGHDAFLHFAEDAVRCHW